MLKESLNKRIHQLPVIVENDETGGYVVECPFLDGCYSQGETLDEALENIKEVISICLDEKEQQKEIFDIENKRFGIHTVTV